MLNAHAASKTKAPLKSKPDPVEQAHERVRYNMKDPESARFRGDFAGKDGAICGFVNGKNGYGGYGGFRRYIAEVERVQIESSDASETWKMDSRWHDICSDSEPMPSPSSNG